MSGAPTSSSSVDSHATLQGSSRYPSYYYDSRASRHDSEAHSLWREQVGELVVEKTRVQLRECHDWHDWLKRQHEQTSGNVMELQSTSETSERRSGASKEAREGFFFSKILGGK